MGGGFQGAPGAGGMQGGFDPMAMAMMYQNMMKNSGMGEYPVYDSVLRFEGMGMGGNFDPNAMAMMYQNMMKSESRPSTMLCACHSMLMTHRHGRYGQRTRYQPQYGRKHDAQQYGNGRDGDEQYDGTGYGNGSNGTDGRDGPNGTDGHGVQQSDDEQSRSCSAVLRSILMRNMR